MTLSDLLGHCERFANLGEAVGSQVAEVGRNPETASDQNPAALERYGADFFEMVRRQADRDGDDELRIDAEDALDAIAAVDDLPDEEGAL